MTLIERLREYGPHNEHSAFGICDEAADRIEALEARIEELQSIIRAYEIMGETAEEVNENR